MNGFLSDPTIQAALIAAGAVLLIAFVAAIRFLWLRRGLRVSSVMDRRPRVQVRISVKGDIARTVGDVRLVHRLPRWRRLVPFLASATAIIPARIVCIGPSGRTAVFPVQVPGKGEIAVQLEPEGGGPRVASGDMFVWVRRSPRGYDLREPRSVSGLLEDLRASKSLAG